MLGLSTFPQAKPLAQDLAGVLISTRIDKLFDQVCLMFGKDDITRRHQQLLSRLGILCQWQTFDKVAQSSSTPYAAFACASLTSPTFTSRATSARLRFFGSPKPPPPGLSPTRRSPPRTPSHPFSL